MKILLKIFGVLVIVFIIFVSFVMKSSEIENSKPDWSATKQLKFEVACESLLKNVSQEASNAKNYCECLMEGIKLNNVPSPDYGFNKKLGNETAALIKRVSNKDFSIKCKEKFNIEDYYWIN